MRNEILNVGEMLVILLD